jgi:transcriptional regulator with XRE-family HTH domain
MSSHVRYVADMTETQADAGGPAERLRRHNGIAIRCLREKDGWSQTAFAAMVGLTQAGLSNIEIEAKGALLSTLNRIARALSVPVGAILRETVSGADVASAETPKATAAA